VSAHDARARTADARAAVLRAIGAAWDAAPNLRLGQLLDNALVRATSPYGVIDRLFYVEDADLADVVTSYVAEVTS
jgi:hypothetical protein